MRRDPIQIDPVGCGCTECLTGEYVPLDLATDEQIRAMLAGEMHNATSEQFTLTTTLTAEYCGRTWTISETQPDLPYPAPNISNRKKVCPSDPFDCHCWPPCYQ